jgi:hypothetical protein
VKGTPKRNLPPSRLRIESPPPKRFLPPPRRFLPPRRGF